MGKYEKRIGKIWDKFDGNDDELLSFAKENHPSVQKIKDNINTFYSQVSRVAINKEPNSRLKTIEHNVWQSWSYYMKHDQQEFLFNEWCDQQCCKHLFSITFAEYEEVNAWSGRCFALEISEKDLDEQWELNWENYADDDCWGSTNLKDSIWNDEYGIRRDMLWHINHMQQLITPSHWEEINSRKEKVNSSFSAFKKLREKFEEEREAGKYDDYSRGEIRAIKPVWRHSREYEKPAREIDFICDDLWKNLDHEEIYTRLEKENNE